MKQVIVFHQSGCPACAHYLPRFKKVAVKYRAFLNIQTPNLARADAKMLKAANGFKITAVPTTVVLDEKDKLIEKAEGAVSDAEIVKLLERAAK